MKCPKCGSSLRPSKKYPGYYLCDTCRKRYSGSSVTREVPMSSTNKKRKKKKHLFAKLLLFLSLIIAIFAGFYFSGILQLEDKAEPVSKKIDTFSTSDTADYNGLMLNVSSVQTINGNDFVKPSTGNIYLLVEICVENKTDASKYINGISDFSLLNTGETIPHSASAYELLSETQSRIDFELASMQKASGFLCFEVPENWTTLELQFANPVWSLQKIQFELKNSPN